MTNVNQKVNSKVDKKEVSKPVSIATMFQTLGVKYHTDKKDLAFDMYFNFKKLGITKTKAKNPLTKEVCLRQINMMSGDIRKERKGWWSTFQIVNEDKKFQIVPKQVKA